MKVDFSCCSLFYHNCTIASIFSYTCQYILIITESCSFRSTTRSYQLVLYIKAADLAEWLDYPRHKKNRPLDHRWTARMGGDGVDLEPSVMWIKKRNSFPNTREGEGHTTADRGEENPPPLPGRVPHHLHALAQTHLRSPPSAPGPYCSVALTFSLSLSAWTEVSTGHRPPLTGLRGEHQTVGSKEILSVPRVHLVTTLIFINRFLIPVSVIWFNTRIVFDGMPGWDLHTFFCSLQYYKDRSIFCLESTSSCCAPAME
jgi:hypothetical protein